MTAGPATLRVDGIATPILVRRSARARRFTLRVDMATGDVAVTAPAGVRDGDVRRFLDAHGAWIRAKLESALTPIPFVDGLTIPMLGQRVPIRHDPDSRSGARLVDGVLRVGGATDHVNRRVRDLLVARARSELTARSQGYAGALGRTVKRVIIKDTRSRWGSCSAAGNINYSWRLVLAPDAVLDYVAAHECCHLVEMNHSDRFWALVQQLRPDMEIQRRWLKRNGAQLHRYG